jgi:Fe-S cluster biogenesis protein NfuA/Fe-S cluster assembly iron-binding protein IscA
MPAISVTELAMSKLAEYLSEEPDDTVVRLLVEHDGKYGLSLDQKVAGDTPVEATGSDAAFVIESSFADVIDGVKIDYLDQGASSGFSLTGGTPTSSGSRPTVLRTEETPNPDARKFVLSVSLGKESKTWNSAEGEDTPEYVKQLFALAGVASIFQLDRFLTITRASAETEWEGLLPEATKVLNAADTSTTTQSKSYDESDTSVEARLVRFIESDVAPFLQQDGGDIEFVEFDEGVVKVKLHGACGTCPSSTATLHMGVERRLKEQFSEVSALERVG